MHTTTLIPAGTYAIDPDHTTVEFAVKHLGFATIKGRAGGVTGTVTGGDHPRVEATIPVAQLTTLQPERDQHLQTPDFFDAAAHPEIRFEADRIEHGPEGPTLAGALTIRGVTKPFVLKVTPTADLMDPWGARRIGFDVEGEIDRRDFGVSWDEVLPAGSLLVANTVPLSASGSAATED